MEGTPVLTFNTHLTAVAATSTGDYTVVFVGTNEGHLKKVSARVYSLYLGDRRGARARSNSGCRSETLCVSLGQPSYVRYPLSPAYFPQSNSSVMTLDRHDEVIFNALWPFTPGQCVDSLHWGHCSPRSRRALFFFLLPRLFLSLSLNAWYFRRERLVSSALFNTGEYSYNGKWVWKRDGKRGERVIKYLRTLARPLVNDRLYRKKTFVERVSLLSTEIFADLNFFF